MAQNKVRSLIQAGMHFTEDSQAKAEKLVKDLVKAGELRRKDAEETVQALIARGKQATEQVLTLVQSEVSKQMSRFTDRIDSVENRVEEIASKVGLASKPSPAAESAPAPAKKSPVKKAAPAKKAAAKKAAPAKKAVVKKTASS